VEIRDGVITGADVSRLGVICYDPGFYNTAACRSSITHIDGAAGQLEYRGFPIDDLARSRSYTEVSHLLVHGVLPNNSESETYRTALRQAAMLPERCLRTLDALPSNTHPMVALQIGVAALSPEPSDGSAELTDQAIRLVAQVPAVVAYIHARERADVLPDELVARFLHRREGPNVDPRLIRALDVVFILHADHEQNCSTNVVRAVLSSGAGLFTAASAGVGALSGPLHGGANEAVLRMLEEIGSIERIPDFIAAVVTKQRKLFGFGHPVYKNYDPRAAILKEIVRDALDVARVDDQLLSVALALEEAALAEPYFIDKHLYPNVDFYSGLVYRALGFRSDEFTCLFAAARASGWAAHALEQSRDADARIYRPRQLYEGPKRRSIP